MAKHISKHTHRIFNFSAGPAPLPTTVMLRAQEQFSNYNDLGMGIMEMSHRDVDGPVQQQMENARTLLIDLLKIPSNFRVLFFQGGAHGQFAAVPMNLLEERKQASYVITGYWSQRAADEGKKYADVHIAASSEEQKFRCLPDEPWNVPEDSAYVHFCANETIHGCEYLTEPSGVPDSVPLIGDFTSTLLSREIEWSKYGAIYASGGKNLGPAGVCAAIVREDLLDRQTLSACPSVLDWEKMNSSTPIPNIYNTPPTFLVYMMALNLEFIKENGGVEALQRRARARAHKLYDIIDSSNDFYWNGNTKSQRSLMNVCMRIGGEKGNPELEKLFTKESAEAGMLQLFGHPLFGGLRVTLYNGIPDEAVDKCAEFMMNFMQKHS